METAFVTLGLSIVLFLLPPPLRDSGLAWTTFAVSIFFLTFYRHVERMAQQRIYRVDTQGHKRCDCCGAMVKGSDSLCFHCKLEASYRAYSK